MNPANVRHRPCDPPPGAPERAAMNPRQVTRITAGTPQANRDCHRAWRVTAGAEEPEG
jgi:hypothetical protein